MNIDTGTPPVSKWPDIDQLSKIEIDFLQELVLLDVVAPMLLPSEDGAFSVIERAETEARPSVNIACTEEVLARMQNKRDMSIVGAGPRDTTKRVKLSMQNEVDRAGWLAWARTEAINRKLSGIS